jgi:hypothetical protein
VEVLVGSKVDGLIEDERWLVDELGTTMILERRLGVSTDLSDNAVPIKCSCLRSLAYPLAVAVKSCLFSSAFCMQRRLSIGVNREWTKPESKAEGFKTILMR